MIDTWIKSSFSGYAGCVEINWRKSSFSTGGNCVEVNSRKSSFSGDTECIEISHQSNVKIRNSKNPDRCILEFKVDAVSSWIKGIKNSEFDNFV